MTGHATFLVDRIVNGAAEKVVVVQTSGLAFLQRAALYNIINIAYNVHQQLCGDKPADGCTYGTGGCRLT